ncbi:MAG: prepilin-type N-terminal cleavage/methylation domain-containing protein [Pseudomonadota bacterium]
MPPLNFTSKKQGFTLIELSIVLVIIGLIVGGVLVGRDLINSAAIRSQISQIEKYNTAANTFKLKYGGLPGDLLATDAASLGFFKFASGPATGWGDNNGAITTTNSSGDAFCRDEVLIFWQHLVEAKMIEGSYSANVGTNPGDINSNGFAAVMPTTHEMINAHLPEAKIGRSASIIAGANWVAGSRGGANYFAISGINEMFGGTSGYLRNSTNPFTPQEAYNIDVKMDNGVPNSGKVIATDETAAYNPRPGLFYDNAPTAACVTANAYVINSTTPSCSLQIQFQ